MSGAPANSLRLAQLALDVLTLDPVGLGGLHLRGRVGPARARVMALLANLPLPMRRIHPGIDDIALFGGMDLAATLATGSPRQTPGLLATPCALVLTMAERAPQGLAARLAQHLDAGTSCLIALDESADPDESLAQSLAERLGLFIDLSPFDSEDAGALDTPRDIASARGRLAQVQRTPLPAPVLRTIAQATQVFGIDSARAGLFATRAAMAIAALRGLSIPDEDCIQDAAALCLAHRAAFMPPDAAQPDSPPTPPSPSDADTGQDPQDAAGNLLDIPSEVVLEAVRAALPPDVLARLAASRSARGMKGGAGTGAKIKGNHRGRPLPARAGRLSSGQRLDIIATLRAAAPLQTLRGAGPMPKDLPLRLAIRASDFRIKRYQHFSDRVLIFTVDASGSAAFARLAEAKGAVELLLAHSYARRDHVALLAFRGQSCEVVLQPTRSLTATKRRLAGLAGGGGTPLATGLRMALNVALQTRARGMTPTVALLTDGRGNIALDGSANRAAAEADSRRMAQVFAASGLSALIIDIGTRAAPALADLAGVMGATYVPLPRADAQRLAQVLQAGIGA